MPEGPELHLSSLFVNKICKNTLFSGKVVKSEVSWKNPEVEWDCPAYSVHAISRGKEVKLTLTEVKQESDTKDDKKAKVIPKIMSILFRFGMSGSFKFDKVTERHKHAHLNFFTQDGENVLSFVDVRRFGRWEVNADWSKERGPCVIFEYDAFRENVLINLNNSAFERPICEVLLNQKYFNGIGNYLRAEILYRLGIPPFAKARDVLEPLTNSSNHTDEKPVKKETDKTDADILKLCNILPLEVVNLGGTAYTLDSEKDYSSFSDWLQCYYNPDMKNMVDHNGRTIWFSGPCGPLAPKENKSKKRKTKTKLEKGDKKENDEPEDAPSNKRSRRQTNQKAASVQVTPGKRRSTRAGGKAQNQRGNSKIKTPKTESSVKKSTRKSAVKEEDQIDTKVRRRSTRTKNDTQKVAKTASGKTPTQGKNTKNGRKNASKSPASDKVAKTKSSTKEKGRQTKRKNSANKR